ncbi:MAG: hypothetical protein EOO04_00210 [Chitinophagaceae bacterium]|nr:MAG: hypothetical protein EOO04_00210 [Chitinophagaceae bacterium]
MKFSLSNLRQVVLTATCSLFATAAFSQTDADGIMMSKNNFCTALQYSYSSWENYWEGTRKRDNENLGTVSTQMVGWMGNYGVSDKLNVLFSIPYVLTKASAGTLHGVNGLQDLSFALKYKLITRNIAAGRLNVMAVGGYSFPVTNYVADYQPLALGLRSRNLTLRLTGDYEYKKYYVTASAAYLHRSNIKIDRDYYYTDEGHYTNEVDMPDAATFQLRLGYRGGLLGAEAMLSNWTTLGGFDITRNNMPFPSNRMNATMAGVNLKCNPRAFPGMGLMAGANYTLAGRNMGQAFGVSAGLSYVFDFSKKSVKSN